MPRKIVAHTYPDPQPKTGDGLQHKLPANGDKPIGLRHCDYQQGREMTQAEWVAAAATFPGGRIKASKEAMEDWVGSSARVRHRRGFARDTDLDTIGRYKHTDLRLAIGEVDEGRAGDVQMVGMLETSVGLYVQYKGSREGTGC